MNTVVARVLRVLGGHSPTALIHAVDEHGHEYKFEVPIETTRDVGSGKILVLQWSVHGLPSAETQAIEVVPVEAAEAPPARQVAASGTIDDRPTQANGAEQLEALLGLRPGRLRGTDSSGLP